MANRFYTIMLIPEGTSNVKRFVIPTWALRGLMVVGFFAMALVLMMILDYWYVIKQIELNKDLQIENRRLLQQVEIFGQKMDAIDHTMDRIKSFSTRLKVITNIGEYRNLIQSLNQNLPDATLNTKADHGAGYYPYYRSISEYYPESLDLSSDGARAGRGAGARVDARKPEGRLTEDLAAATRKEQQRFFLDFEDRISRFQFDSLRAEHEVEDLYELLLDQRSFLKKLPTIRPASGFLRSGFGTRRSVDAAGKLKMHEGIDISSDPGTEIYATANGQVSFSGIKPGYGQTVVIDHGNAIETWYSHNSKNTVKNGALVRRGQKVALMGNSGRASGTHLHYEVRIHGFPVDPLAYILED